MLRDTGVATSPRDSRRARLPRPLAVLLDFNGTLSDDEGLLFSVYAEMFHEMGHALTEEDYRLRLAGLSDAAMAAAILGEGHRGIADFVAERVRRYRERAGDGSTIGPEARAAVGLLAGAMPVAVVSAAFRVEIDDVLAGAGLSRAISLVVSVDEVSHPKPHPEAYVRALALLSLRPSQVVAVEDTPAGIAAATAAGIACVAVRGTVADERLGEAMLTADRLDAALARLIIGGLPARGTAAPL
jgi:beta-phosphoglucomutase